MPKIMSQKRARRSHCTDNFDDLKTVGAQVTTYEGTDGKETSHIFHSKLIYTDKIHISLLLIS